MESINADQNRTESIDVCRIKIVPDLSVPIDSAATVDVDIIASKFEESCHILEAEFERVCLPVHSIVRELNVRLNI